MSRRRKKRQLVPTTWLEWTPELAKLFRLVPADWTPPPKVRACAGRVHWTLSARFRTDTGLISTAIIRLEPGDAGGWSVASESLRQTFISGPRT